MLDNIILSFNVVAPLFLEMLLGIFLRHIKLLDHHTTAAINKLIFKCFLPILLFYNIYNTRLEEITSYTYMYVVMGGIIIIFLLLMLLVPFFEEDRKKCGVLIQAGFRSNFVLFGIPVATLLLGEDHTGAVSLLIAIVIPLFNILSVADLEYFRGQNMNIKNVMLGIIQNPLIIASVLGILLNLSGIQFITCVESTISGVAKIATPLALIALGAEFRLDAVRKYWRQLTAGLVLRLVIVPVVMITVAAALGIRGEEFIGILIVFSAPVAVNSYIMAEMMDGDGILASQLVFYSTGLSILTLFILIFVTKTLGFY